MHHSCGAFRRQSRGRSPNETTKIGLLRLFSRSWPPSEIPYPRFARSRSEGTSPRYHEGTGGTPVSRDSRTFQRACSSIGQLAGRRENQNAVHILDSSVSVHLTDVSIVISHILISHREIFLEENIIRPLQSLVRPSRRVRNSPYLPLSKRKAEMLRLHSLTLVASPIIV